jgi:hypothetical protein
MLNVLLRGKWTGLAKFLQYLEQTDVKVVNRDQWCSVYEFSTSILPDHTNYDDMEAWSVTPYPPTHTLCIHSLPRLNGHHASPSREVLLLLLPPFRTACHSTSCLWVAAAIPPVC